MKNFISLKNSREFGNVYKQGISYVNKYLVMYVLENGLKENRIGISVSKKVGNSVVRHRVTRLIRESYRLNKYQMKQGFDIVFVARVNAKECNYQKIERAMLHLASLQKVVVE